MAPSLPDSTLETPSAVAPLRIGRLEIDLAHRRLLREGRALRLSAIEWHILKLLVGHAGQILTHRMLLQQVWGDAAGASSDYLYTYIRRLRRKLEDDPAYPRYIRTEPGIGYRFVPAYPADSAAPAAPLQAFPHHPVPLTALIGRTQDVLAIRQSIERDGIRLLTLVGPPGVGKTRLGVQVAVDLRPAFADGVYVVALAAVRDPRLVPAAIAQALGVADSGGAALVAQLGQYLRDRHMLLVLDNFEHLVVAAPLIAELLAAPRLSLLITSRAALHLSGEHEFPVRPLALPGDAELPPLDVLARTPAVALFVERARAVRPDFALTNANAAAVVEICARLDGLPLAIELAAARIKLLPAPTLLAHLDHRLSLLTGGARDRPAHQQSLRSTLDWSYELLEQGAQALLARLGVFVGGWTLEAAETVCNVSELRTEDGGWKIDAPPAILHPPSSILNGLAALIDQSLLQQIEGESGEPRFQMLETIREYALEQLERHGEVARFQRRHATFYLALAEQAEPGVRGPQQAIWLDRLHEEHANLRAALGWAIDRGEVDMALRFGVMLWRFWWIRGHLGEGRLWLEAALKMSDLAFSGQANGQPPQPWLGLHAQALDAAGVLAHNQGDFARAGWCYDESLRIQQALGDQRATAVMLGRLVALANDQCDYPRARMLGEESLAILRALGDQRGMAITIGNLTLGALDQCDYTRVLALSEERLALARALGDQQLIAMDLNIMGCVAMDHEGDYDQARELFEQSRQIFHELGDEGSSIPYLDNLGMLALYKGDLAQAQTYLAEGLALGQKLGDSWGMALILNHLGTVLRYQGRYAEAAECVRESLTLRHAQSERRGIAACLEGFAALAALQGQPARAARLGGMATAIRDAISAPMTPPDRALYEQTLAIAHASTDPAAWAAAWAEGRATTLEQAVAYALDDAEETPSQLAV